MIDFPANWLLLAQDAAQEVGVKVVPVEQAESVVPLWAVYLIVAAILALPFVLGSVIAKMLKLKDISGRLGTVLFTFVLGLTPFVWQIAAGDSWTDAIRLGIDLAGGNNLVYQIDVEQAERDGKEVTADVVDRMVAAVMRRLDPANQEQITVRRVGTDRIEVIIPGADRDVVEKKKRDMTRLGKLEFAILANGHRHAELIATAKKSDARDVRQGTRIAASWRPVGSRRDGIQKDVGDEYDVTSRVVEIEGEEVKQFLVIFEEPDERVTGKYLRRAYPTTGESGRTEVGFTFNTEGGFRFEKLTSRHKPEGEFRHRLAVLLDDQIHSAPSLQSTISDTGSISGDFTSEEIDELVNVLNAGALEVPIKPDPISEFSISPLLGQDVQEKGKWAIIYAAGAVVLFMFLYYRKAGVIANLCLLLNITLVMGSMALIKGVFTLPGLAGIVLTIGMAVDANVLIFERIREELQRGSSLRMAIQNGFEKATSTIVDANLTTLITAVVLYVIGTDQVRGFAVTLFIGIVMSMYSTLIFGRLIFDVLERKRWIKSLKMASVVGSTSLNFLAARKVAMVISIALIVGGMGVFFSRGEDNLDIDFTGGTMVTIQFVEPQNIDEVRGVLTDGMGTNITLEGLRLGDDTTNAAAGGKLFRLRTKNQNIAEVRSDVDRILTASGRELRKVRVDYAAIEPIPLITVKAGPDDKTDDDGKPANANGSGSEGESSEGNGESGADVAGKDADKKEEGAIVGAVASDDEFAGGNQVHLTLTGDVPTSTIQDYIAEELAALETDGGQKYDQPESLLRVIGTAGPGMTAVENASKRYTQMLAQSSPVVSQSDYEAALDRVQQRMEHDPIFEEVNTFAKTVANEMQTMAVIAMLTSLVAIVAYIWLRFQRITFGFAAVAALVHDVLVVLGLVAVASYASGTQIATILRLDDFKINLPMIAAFLTIVGYSLNDTIVVFDRIREVRGKNPALTVDMVNTSLNQTLSRTILTSLTTFIVVGILYIWGGEGIHGFAFCLVLGVIVGTYSSIYVASPVLLWLMNRPGSEVGQATAAARRT